MENRRKTGISREVSNNDIGLKIRDWDTKEWKRGM